MKFFERNEDITLNCDENSSAIVIMIPANKETALNLNDNPEFHHDEHLPEKKKDQLKVLHIAFFQTGSLNLVVTMPKKNPERYLKGGFTGLNIK